jgi:hypothetical protein
MFKKFFTSVKSKVVAGFVVVSTVAPVVAMAAQDYSDITDGITAEITAVLPAALGILALTMGIPIAIHVLRRVAR